MTKALLNWNDLPEPFTERQMIVRSLIAFIFALLAYDTTPTRMEFLSNLSIVLLRTIFAFFFLVDGIILLTRVSSLKHSRRKTALFVESVLLIIPSCSIVAMILLDLDRSSDANSFFDLILVISLTVVGLIRLSLGLTKFNSYAALGVATSCAGFWLAYLYFNGAPMSFGSPYLFSYSVILFVLSLTTATVALLSRLRPAASV